MLLGCYNSMPTGVDFQRACTTEWKCLPYSLIYWLFLICIWHKCLLTFVILSNDLCSFLLFVSVLFLFEKHWASWPKHTWLRQWGIWQCLPFSWATLRGIHCRHPVAVMGIVDMLGLAQLLQWRRNWLTFFKKEGC